MTQQPVEAPATVGRPRSSRRPVLLAVLIGFLVLAAGGVLAYRLVGTTDDDPGVTACRSADVVVRADRGERVDPAELKRVGGLFEDSAHEDLKTSGVPAVGLSQRVGGTGPGAESYRRSLHEAVPRLVAACDAHGITVKA
ncbi:hypothetical protein [Micromonospora sp. AMSO31t]|uniref:hypothetical protein n=1 Tax=Micromonospora sp. AMSO31t TaxID=2650566 RepID=UPI00124B80D9|nr:hypothetical protein [Micromonospora sp. AMSO31t]KAB1909900.1 hypothetical protein F8274_21450 [Micromonospora sp. AMSO31t]